MINELIQACEWGTSNFLVISSNVFSPLLYYSYLGSVIPALLIAFFIFLNGRKELPNKLLLLTVLSFSVWVFSAMVTWATEFPHLTMFFWTLLNTVEPFVYFFAFYFFYAYVFNRDFSTLQKFIFSVPLVLTLLLAPSRLMLLGYNLSDCERNAYEGILGTYGYGIEILYAILIVSFAIHAFINFKAKQDKKQLLLLTIGIIAFLISFSLGNILEVFTENWYIGQYGLFGAPIFTAFLAYLIVRYKAFNLKLIAAQALVVALWLLVMALLFIRSIENIRVVVAVTLIFVLILGIILVRSVNREIEQRERIEKLAEELESANSQQVILIHFITHQIKGFIAKSRNIFSLMLDGDYGALPDTARQAAAAGLDSDTRGAQTIAEILNAANIKSGKVSYAKESIDLKAVVEELVKDLKPLADSKGLALTTTLAPVTLTGDKGQLVNALKNLIDNSIKYTQKGTVGVTLAQAGGKVRFEIIDTGVGIDADDMKNLFTEGGRGKNSQKINVESTGFGLYIVKNIIEAHKGSVWAESEGASKGSHFIVELPT